MGLVLKQSISNMITTYIGFAIGAVNVLFLYPHFLKPEYYGLITFLLSASTLVWPIMSFGAPNTMIKFYSAFESQIQKNRLLTVMLVIPLLVSMVIGSFGVLFYQSLLNYFENNKAVQNYIVFIYVISIAIAYFEVFYSWAKLTYKSVFGNFMKEVFHRVGVTVLLLAVYFDYLNLDGFIYFLTAIYVIRMFILMIYAFKLLPPKLDFKLPEQISRILKYSVLILIAGSISTALLDLDKVMIEHYLPIKLVSVYSIAVYIASVIAVPARAMKQITSPITASLLNQKKKVELNDLYQKTSSSLLLVSGLIFILIVVNVNKLYELIPAEYQIEVGLIVLLCAIKLYENFLGNNNSILFNSDYYRLVLIIGVVIVLLAIILNITFIPLWGIWGAAIATFSTFFTFFSIKLYLVYKKFGMHPFNKKTLPIVVLITITSLLLFQININLHPLFAIAIKSILACVLYGFIVYQFNFSEDLNSILKKYKKK
ncbi:Membrane protein involved in the export of O-antigen and teichoic acid [Mesonia phycicola]|uniref:Membrane protein involved in the export of O-antigen and teichoic acid n=1 Tax=Mesonia phycicola TaxID=579105 RepID=A0A1M6BUM2_9FLAO|nr:polysaccharide biosynthesis C-terminal domain-containing protein [Mesonia phycicola]SHI52440.1 Membrane protein involved in the export of O-antigen and teichoic acid [Mesonia phycicola]